MVSTMAMLLEMFLKNKRIFRVTKFETEINLHKMKYKTIYLLSFLLLSGLINFAQKPKLFHVSSPDNKIDITLEMGSKTSWLVKHESTVVIAPSSISLSLDNGEALGTNAKIISSKTENVNTTFNTPFYKRKTVTDNYNQLTINCKGDFGIIVRAYNDGAAYRFFTKKKGEITVQSEEANFNFEKDYQPSLLCSRSKDSHDLFQVSFESLYDEIPLSKFVKDSIAFLPLLVNEGEQKKAVILEADLEEYPGMFLTINTEQTRNCAARVRALPTRRKT